MSLLTRALAIALAVLCVLALCLGVATWYYQGEYTRAAAELAQARANYAALDQGTAQVGKASREARTRAAEASKKVQRDPEAQAWAEQELPAAIQEALK